MDNEKQVNVLGVNYKLRLDNSETNLKLSELEGYCDTSTKEIAVNNYSVARLLDKSKQSVVIKKIIRHEITHAFLYESGLDVNSEWATNEELIDWIAMQGLKLFKAWQEAGAIDE